ncbi:MAG: GSCFA domain-containing protein [Ferrovibrio sp.]|uniref:GSCFA domain-containing protein n=1 Tax=Ferrovibrio sp. TaxID=1917215 RepID=UPI003918BD13
MTKLNRTWDDFIKTRTIGVDDNRLIGAADRVFTMGSCFANEIRLALSKRGFTLLPELTGEFKKHVSPASHEMPSWGVYDERVHYQFYTTFSMLQEFEKAFGLWQHEPSDVWAAIQKTEKGNQPIFQEPYKRRLFAHSHEDLLAMRRLMEGAIRDGIMTADVLVLTMGLTEIWQRGNGRYVCEPPKLRSREIMQDCRYFGSTYEQNLDNMRRLCSLYFNAFPDRNIVLTVSPVALSRTFSPHDIVVANMESKSTLRAVAAQICREFKNVHYFPSFELCMTDPEAFEEDGRHVRPKKVEAIMSTFLTHFLKTEPVATGSQPAAAAAAPAATAVPARPVEDNTMVTNRRDSAGNAYEHHWSETRAAIDRLIASGERSLPRIMAQLFAGEPETNKPALEEIGYRIAGRIAQSPLCDGSLEYRLFEAQKLWLLRRSLPAGVTDIAELGSGTGSNLFALWHSGLPAAVRLHALEYTAAGRACAEKLAALAPEIQFRSAPFDYYNAALDDLRDAGRLFVFSCYSIEQITYLPDSFFDHLIAMPNLAGVLHIEPVGWQYGLAADADAVAVEVDRRMRKSVARKGYNQSLVPQLHALAKAGRIVIEEELPHFLAHRPDLPGTAIRWRPAR